MIFWIKQSLKDNVEMKSTIDIKLSLLSTD